MLIRKLGVIILTLEEKAQVQKYNDLVKVTVNDKYLSNTSKSCACYFTIVFAS